MSDSSLPEAGARLTLDLSEWESNWSQVISDADTLQSTIEDMSTTIDIDVEFSGADALPFDDIPESTDTEVNVTEDDNTKKLVDGLTFLVMKEKIEWAIDIAGNVWDFFSKIENLVVSPFLDVEDAVARINAQTGGTGITDLAQFIRDIQAADLGTGVDQIADVVVAAQQLNAPIDEATRAALTFTKVFDDQDPTTVLTALNTLVETGLVPNLQSASDLMTVFFQEGGNKGGDALAVVTANAQSWADMGLNATQALSTINSLLDNNVDSATDAQKMIQTLDDALTTAAANADSPQAEALKTLGLTNPKDSGQAMGADFLDGFSSAFTNLPSDQQDLVSGVLFGKGGKKFTGALEGITTQGGPFADVVGAAEDAASAIDDSLRGIIDDFVLAMNEKLSELLSSDSIDLPGKIEALKAGLQEALDIIASGGTVGEAIEFGLNIPGFADGVDRFQSAIGNFAISVLEIVAGIQEFLGKDSSGTRQQISQMERGQLAFDLQVANPDEIAGELQTAIDRGLTTSDIATSTGKALEEMIAGGDFEKAQALIDGLNKLSESTGPMIAPNLNGAQISEAEAALRDGDLTRIQEQIDKGNLIAPVSVDTEVFQANLDTAIEEAKPDPPEGWWDNFRIPVDKLMPETLTPEGRSMSDTGGGTQWWNSFAGPEAQTAITDTTTAMSDLGTTTSDVTNAMTNAAGVSTDSIVAGIVAMQEAANAADAGIATAFTENTVTSSFEAVASAASRSFPSVIQWMAQVQTASAQLDVVVSGHIQHLINILHDLQFLSAQVATGVQQAITLGGQLPGGSSVTNNNTSVTVNNNVQSNAQAAANGYAIGASLRPGGV